MPHSCLGRQIRYYVVKVRKYCKENKLKISIPDEIYKKYAPLIEDKILDAV